MEQAGGSGEAHAACLRQAVLFMLKQSGYATVSPSAVEKLTCVYEDIICQISSSLHSTSEHCGRTQPMFPDCVVALSDLGIDLQSLPAFRHNNPTSLQIPPPQPSLSSSHPKGLSSGRRQQFPSYIPSYMPHLPDPHTYTKSLIYKKPLSEFEIMRERRAIHKSSSEAALTKYITQTAPTRDLFGAGSNLVTLIKPKTHPRPYLHALLTPDIHLHTDRVETGKKGTTKSDLQGGDLGKCGELSDVKAQNAFLKPCKFAGAAKQVKKKGAVTPY